MQRDFIFGVKGQSFLLALVAALSLSPRDSHCHLSFDLACSMKDT